MKASDVCIALIKSFESLELDAYPDPKTGGKPWTIGWGHTHGVAKGDHCTPELAEAYLREDVAEAEGLVNANFTSPFTQGQFDALVSIVYNVGPGREGHRDGIVTLKSGRPSTLRGRWQVGDYAGCAAEFDKWVSPGSNVERGLRRRRAEEKALFLS